MFALSPSLTPLQDYRNAKTLEWIRRYEQTKRLLAIRKAVSDYNRLPNS